MAKETFKEKLKDRHRSGKTELKQNIGIASNRVRGAINIFKGKGTFREKMGKVDDFNAKTQGVLDVFKRKK